MFQLAFHFKCSVFFIEICAIEALDRHVLPEPFQVVNPAGAEEVCFEVKSIFCPYFFLAVSYLYLGVFQVWDKDTLSPDDFIGRVSICFNQISEEI